MTPLEQVAFPIWENGLRQDGLKPGGIEEYTEQIQRSKSRRKEFADNKYKDRIEHAIDTARAVLLALAEFDFKGPHLLPDEAFKARLRSIASEGKDNG